MAYFGMYVMPKSPNRRSRVTEATKAFYSPAELAGILGLHPDTVMNYIHAEKVYAIKLSARTYRIPAREVTRLTHPELLKPPRITKRRVSKGTIAAFLRAMEEEHRKPVRS